MEAYEDFWSRSFVTDTSQTVLYLIYMQVSLLDT